MIYFTTGANGAGKTLLTLRDVRAQQLKENRPVYFHGFDMDPAKAAEFGWQEFDPKEWQALPDGSICIMDECQNEFPLRRSGSEVPAYINAIAQHRRKRGFDFWLIAPHPSLIDVFVRRLIDKPSWHRHLKRTFGADLVSELKFSSPDLKCEDPGSGARGEVRMVAYPKEVYGWYRSASLHTGKKRLPKQFWMLMAAVVLVPTLFFFAFKKLPGGSKPPQDNAAPSSATAQAPKAGPMSAIEYVASYTPRIPGMPHTAPRFDSVTAPTEAPYPAACVSLGDKCDCYTQQATKLQTPRDTCLQIVAGGFFMDWKQQTQPAPPPTAKPDVGGPAKAGDGGDPHAELESPVQVSEVAKGGGRRVAPQGAAAGPRSGP